MTTDQGNRNTGEPWEVRRQQDHSIEPIEGYRAYPGVNLLEERDRQRQQLGRELQDLDHEIEASNGYRLRNKLSLLEKSYFVFDANYLNLKHILNEFEQPMVFLRLWEEKNRNRFDLFINDVIRLFHNYLAGAATLLDHIRMLEHDVDWSSDFHEEYRVRFDDQFGNSSLPRFVEDLLTYMLHEGFPFSLAELNFGKVGHVVEVSSAIKLDVDKLREWEQWSEKGWEYLGSLDDKVKLDLIVNEHATIVIEFYRWFVSRQSELRQDAFKELEELIGKRERLQQRIRRLEDTLETAEKSAIAIREERERLLSELKSERERRALEKERADKLEAYLRSERDKGFWSRAFGR